MSQHSGSTNSGIAKTGPMRAFLLCCALTCSAAALASGGGGGGGFGGTSMPSASTPSYDPVVEFQKGVDAIKASQFKDAQRAFDHVLSSNSQHPQANFLAGYSRAALGNDKGALKFYQKAIKYEADLIVAHRELALSLIRLGKRDEAQAELTELQSRAAACAGTCPKASEIDAAVKAVETALSTGTAAPPSGNTTGMRIPAPTLGDQTYLQAVALINEGHYEAAIAQLREASMTFGPHPDILTYLGFAHRKLGRYAQAEMYYRQALAIAPHHVGATEYYGELMVERGDLVGARHMLARLERTCTYGCAETEELRRWIVKAQPGA